MSPLRFPLPLGKQGTILIVLAAVICGGVMGFIPYTLAPLYAEFDQLPALTEIYLAPPWWVWPAAMAVLAAGAIVKDRLIADPEIQFGWNLLFLATMVVLLLIEAVAMVMPYFRQLLA